METLTPQSENVQRAMPVWLRQAGGVLLGTMALAAGPAVMETDPAMAASAPPGQANAALNYVEKMPNPVIAKPTGNKNGDCWHQFENMPYGYYLGEFNTCTDQVTILDTTTNNDYYYLAIKVRRAGGETYWECGWSSDNEVAPKPSGQTTDKSPCAGQVAHNADRRTFGVLFNGAASKYDGPSAPVPLTPECDDIAFRNNKAVDIITAGHSIQEARQIDKPLSDSKGKLDNSTSVNYRFRSRGSQAVDVLSSDLGWSWMDGGCIGGQPTGGHPNPHIRQNANQTSSKQEATSVVGQLTTEKVLVHN